MALGRDGDDRQGMADLVGRMADGFGRLVTQHVTLARLELAEDARAVGADLAQIAAFLPFLLVGYALGCLAVVAVLARWVGWAGSAAVVGVLNAAAGAVGVARGVRRMRGRGVMEGTLQEFKQSASVLAHPVGGGVKESNGDVRRIQGP